MTKLSDPALALRRQMLVSGLFQYVSMVQELEDGYAFKFRRSECLARRIADYVLFEGLHSPGLTFVIVVEPDCAASWLQVRGPGRAKDHIKIACL